MSPLSTVLYPPSAKNYLSPFSAHLVPLCPPCPLLCPEDELIAPQLHNMHWCAVTSLSQVSDASFSILCSCGSVSSSSFVHFVLCPCVASRWIDCSSSLVYLPPPSLRTVPWYKLYHHPEHTLVQNVSIIVIIIQSVPFDRTPLRWHTCYLVPPAGY